jgi:hypothetical protein
MELFTLGEGTTPSWTSRKRARADGLGTTRRGEAAYVSRAVTTRREDDPRVTALRPRRSSRFCSNSRRARSGSREAAGALRRARARPRGVEDYARFLKSKDYDVSAFLRRSSSTPSSIRPTCVGARIAGPVDYLVGSARRLSVEPPPTLLWLAAGQLGQRLLEPPSVKGWDGGQAWITTSTLMQRGNMAGMLLGVVKLEDVLRPEVLDEEPEPGDSMGPEMGGAGDDGDGDDAMRPEPKPNAKGDKPTKKKNAPGKAGLNGELGQMSRMLSDGYVPAINLCVRMQRAGAQSDAAIVERLADELLAVALTPESRAGLVEFLAADARDARRRRRRAARRRARSRDAAAAARAPDPVVAGSPTLVIEERTR